MRKVDARILLVAAGLLFSLLMLFWYGQFRYSWHPDAEEGRFVGVKYDELINKLGEPDKQLHSKRRGHEIEPMSDFDKIASYKPIWGDLILYFKKSECVGSVFYTDHVRF